jgi:hypothetical protein
MADVPVTSAPADPGSGNSAEVTSNVTHSENSEPEFLSDEEYAKLSKRKVKHKVDGKEVALTFEELTKGYSHGSAANKRFEEAAELRKQAATDKKELEAQIARLKDPKAAREFLSKHLGEEGFSNLAHETVAEALKRELLSPEELQAEQEKRELEEFKAQKKAKEEESHKLARQAKVDQFSNDVMSDLKEFGQKLGRSIQPHEMESLLNIMIGSLEGGYELNLDEAWQYVHKQEAARIERYLNSVEIDKLPKDFVEKVRKHSLSSLPFQGRKQEAAPSPSPSMVKDEGINASDYFKSMRGK